MNREDYSCGVRTPYGKCGEGAQCSMCLREYRDAVERTEAARKLEKAKADPFWCNATHLSVGGVLYRCTPESVRCPSCLTKYFSDKGLDMNGNPKPISGNMYFPPKGSIDPGDHYDQADAASYAMWPMRETKTPSPEPLKFAFSSCAVDFEAKGYDFEDLGANFQDEPLVMKITPAQEAKGEHKKLYKRVLDLITCGVRKPEVTKILNLCNTGDFLNVDKALRLTGDKLIDTYEKQRDCDCRKYPPNFLMHIGVDNRCKECAILIHPEDNDL